MSTTGTTMSDGNAAPGHPDGMAGFWGADGNIRVVRNHEERESAASGVRPFPGDPKFAYDVNVLGGTSTLEVDAKTRELIADWVSLNGTTFNCAGEDGGDGNYVRCLDNDGVLTNIALNRTDRRDDEFAGACFSPDGRTMFVNIQAAIGTTYIIWRDDEPLI